MFDMLLAPLLLLASPQEAACPQTGPEAAIAAIWRGTATTRPAGVDAKTAPLLAIGSPATLFLLPGAQVMLIEAPRAVYATDSHAGYAAIQVTKPGNYRILLSGQGWLEVLKDGDALRTIGNKGGPRCADIRKAVDFALTPDRHVIQIHGNLRSEVRVLVQSID